ncbi:hypothetical protein LPJ61_001170 [Coemansia biformis]|uniref:Uncharacterized protein n=1 Tax=Coemansia biformis TaxID=1286918 RepID=A0A9W7YGI5_9FUNG|nr:hypothetical protein LPJ61_001170 [Coemansia biformis]
MEAPASDVARAQGAYIARPAPPGPDAGGPPPGPAAARSEDSRSRVASLLKLGLFGWLCWWFIRYYEIDRSLRNEPGAPRISATWLGLALCSLLPFVLVYLYASVWRRRILREPLDLQNWQAGSSSLVHAATIGLLFAWIFAAIALFPGYGLGSLLIVAVVTICTVAMVDAAEGVL